MREKEEEKHTRSEPAQIVFSDRARAGTTSDVCGFAQVVFHGRSLHPLSSCDLVELGRRHDDDRSRVALKDFRRKGIHLRERFTITHTHTREREREFHNQHSYTRGFCAIAHCSYLDDWETTSCNAVEREFKPRIFAVHDWRKLGDRKATAHVKAHKVRLGDQDDARHLVLDKRGKRSSSRWG